MMPATQSMGYAFLKVSPIEKAVQKKILEDRLAVAKRLTDAVFDYLTFDVKLALDSQDIEPPPPYQYRYTLDDLNSACKSRDVLQHQIEQMETAIQAAPKEVSDVLRAYLFPPIEAQIAACEHQISEIQRSIEKQDEQGEAR